MKKWISVTLWRTADDASCVLLFPIKVEKFTTVEDELLELLTMSP